MAAGTKYGHQRVRQLEQCSLEMFGDMVVTYAPNVGKLPERVVTPLPFTVDLRAANANEVNSAVNSDKRRASILVDQLLMDIYSNWHSTTDYNSCTSSRSQKSSSVDVGNLEDRSVAELKAIVSSMNVHVERTASVLVRQLKRRDALRRQQEAHCDVITEQLRQRAVEGDTMRFTIQPDGGESGYAQWSAAMKMVATLPGGIPPEFRRRLWLALADKHLAARAVDWPRVERTCFSEWAHPEDSELGVQIVKDLHRTGCSLFCGEDGQENQALLKRVLLAYARWNKSVGYCQGFNMLAALILQVTEKCESDALKLMIYLIEGVLPESYFADSLRGLSVDMAVFRELLRTRLPRLSKHLDTLQNAAKDGTTSYEPPLTNVFTMQWFLTLFCNCLPQPTVLRVWDLIMLEGNEILLRTALAIWQTLSDKILHVRSADEFYCIMGVLTRELLEFNLIDANTLIKAVVTIGSLPELRSLRDHYMYNINPWGTNINSFCSEEDKQIKVYPRERLALDISALKKQYLKLKQRQRQAHIIISAAINRQPPPSTPVAMNHLLLGKSALVPAKRLGPPKGTIPPVRHPPTTLHWKDAPRQDSSSSSSDTELCDDPGSSSSDEEEEEQKPPKTSQLDDTLPSKSDTNLMTDDNIIESCDETISKPIEFPKPSDSPKSSDSPKPSDSPDLGCTDEIDVVNKLIYESDIFDSASTSVKPDFEFKKYDTESDDDFDFELFLQDRVKCLKEFDFPDEDVDKEKEEDRISYSRRNSERALQIIQENSLILHRILQCQSRLSPSPPLVEQARSYFTTTETYSPDRTPTPTNKPVLPLDFATFGTYSPTEKPITMPLDADAAETIISPNDHETTSNIVETENSTSPIYFGRISPSCLNRIDVSVSPAESTSPSWLTSYKQDEKTSILHSSYSFSDSGSIQDERDMSPGYGSKYSSILEKSRNLDVKYNSLIENRRPLSFTLDSYDVETFSFESKLPTETIRSPKAENRHRIMSSTTLEAENETYPTDRDMDSVSPEIKRLGDSKFDPLTVEYPDDTKCSESEDYKLDTQANKRFPTSPSDEAFGNMSGESSNLLKSPSKIFNPFPVQVSSRQNKDVAVKLGLYRK